MYSSAAAFYADANEQLNNSSLNESSWDSPVYYPPIETSSGIYYDNIWNGYEYCYAPAYYGYQYYPELYPPFMPNIYGEFQNDYQTVYYNSPVYYDVYDYPFAVSFVPVIYYPVYCVPIIYSATEVPYQYTDVHDLDVSNGLQYMTTENSYPELYPPFMPNIYGEFQNDYQTVYYNSPVYYDVYDYPFAVSFVPVIYYPVYCVPIIYSATEVPYQYTDVHDLDVSNGLQYMTTENRDGILTPCSAHEIVSAQETTLEIFYEADGERMNDAPFNDDDKKEIDENNSTSCHSEEVMCKDESCLAVVDLDYEDGMLKLCTEFEKLSLYDSEEKSLSSKSDDTSVEDSPSKSDENSVENSSSKSDDNSFGDSSSSDSSSSDSSSSDSSSSDSYEVNDSAIERQGNIMDFHHIEDYSQSAFDTSPWSGDKKIITEENSEVEREVHQLSGQSYIDMIVSSEEYLFVQDNLEHPKRYKDYLYRKSLKNNPRREKNILFDILPIIEEESTPLMDDTPAESEDEINIEDRMIASDEMISSVEDEPIISKKKQPKRRFKAFKKWLSRTFCCCCTTKDPP